jgi:hypothetical protein
MKIRIGMKTPDAVDLGVKKAVQDWWEAHAMDSLGADLEELDSLKGQMIKEEMEKCATWFRHGELVTIEVCTEGMTATVLGGKS